MNINEVLKQADEWAAGCMQKGDAPPWEWYRLMQLREAIAGLSAGPCFGMEGVEESFDASAEYQNAEILPFDKP